MLYNSENSPASHNKKIKSKPTISIVKLHKKAKKYKESLWFSHT